MKVLFALKDVVMAENIAKEYFSLYGEKLEYKNAFYFKAILEAVKNEKFDRIVILEQLEPIQNNVIDARDRMIFENIDSIVDEIDDSVIILICSDGRTKDDSLVGRLFSIGVYNLLLGDEREIKPLCKLIHNPRNRKEAKEYLKTNPIVGDVRPYKDDDEKEVNEIEVINICNYFEGLSTKEAYLKSFAEVESQYSHNQKDLEIIVAALYTQIDNGPDIYHTLKSDPRFAGYCVVPESSDSPKPRENNGKRGILGFLSNKKMKEKNEKDLNKAVANSRKSLEEDRRKAEEKERQEQQDLLKAQQQARIKAQQEAINRQQEQIKMQQEADNRAKQEAQLRAQQEAQLKAQQEAQLKAQQEAQLKAQQEAQLKAQQEAQLKAQQEAQLKAQQEAQLKAQQEAQLKAQQEARLKAEAEQIERQKKEAELKARQEEQARAQQEAIARQKQEAMLKAQQEAMIKAQEQERLKQEEERKLREEAARQKAIQEENLKRQQEQLKAQQEQLRHEKEEALRQQEEKLKLEQERLNNEKQALNTQNVSNYDGMGGYNNSYPDPYANPNPNTSTTSYDMGLGSTNYINPGVAGMGTPDQYDTSSYDSLNTGYINNISTAPTNDNLEDNNLEQISTKITKVRVPENFRKVVLFVGPKKVGTSCIANVVGTLLSLKGVKTSIFDATKSRGLYWYYGDDTSKRADIVQSCMTNLSNGIAMPLQVGRSKNLYLYTSIPTGRENNVRGYRHRNMIESAKKHSNVIIIDADFDTPYDYFEAADEIYLVQDLDLVKVQETLEFFKLLKARRLDWLKLKAVMNNTVRYKYSPKVILRDALTVYQDPTLTFTENFELIRKFVEIPMDINNTANYLEGMEDGKVNIDKFSEPMKRALHQVVNWVLVPAEQLNSGKRW